MICLTNGDRAIELDGTPLDIEDRERLSRLNAQGSFVRAMNREMERLIRDIYTRQVREMLDNQTHLPQWLNRP